ncbi:hypothetical protein CLOM_g9566 [Closterium sp. NIES-68]|nr:hypothetical protein CLOM_g9566 [Closterium sp. NIES-68]
MPCKGHGGIEGVAIAVALTTAKVVAGLGTSGGVVALVQEEEWTGCAEGCVTRTGAEGQSDIAAQARPGRNPCADMVINKEGAGSSKGGIWSPGGVQCS